MACSWPSTRSDMYMGMNHELGRTIVAERLVEATNKRTRRECRVRNRGLFRTRRPEGQPR